VNSDTRFTLVLGGGGMKGLAHIGVLQALTERGLVPTHIVGSSVGALVGAAWSAGRSVAELREIAVNLRRRDIFVVAHADMAFKRMRSYARPYLRQLGYSNKEITRIIRQALKAAGYQRSTAAGYKPGLPG